MVDEMNEAEKDGEIIQWDPDSRPVVPENPISPYPEERQVHGADR